MSLVVRLHRAATEAHGRDLFVCTARQWEFLHELAHTFGWQAHGTTYELPANSKLTSVALRNYEPGDAADPKFVSTEDAVEWARALERAQDSGRLDSLATAQQLELDHGDAGAQSLGHWLAEFIEYAYGGAFTFALETSTSA